MNTLTIISVLVSIICFLIATTISALSKPKYAGESLYQESNVSDSKNTKSINSKWLSRYSGRNRFVKTGRNEKHSKSRRNETTI